jgi:hypothetical protein
VDISARSYSPEAHGGVTYADAMGAPAAVLPDGTVVRSAEVYGALYGAVGLAAVWQLTRLPGVRAAVDANALVLGGHSYGAPTALLALRGGAPRAGAPPVAGVLLHDAALQMSSSSAANAATAPCLFLMSDEYFASDAAREPVEAAARSAAPGSAAFLLRGAAHGNFVDAPWWAPRAVMRGLARLGIPAAGAGDADARLVRGAGFSFSGLALGLDSPRVPPSGGARRMAVRAPDACTAAAAAARGSLFCAAAAAPDTPRARRRARVRRPILRRMPSRRGKRAPLRPPRRPRACAARGRSRITRAISASSTSTNPATSTSKSSPTSTPSTAPPITRPSPRSLPPICARSSPAAAS